MSERIYLDHAATTPARPEVVEAMLPYFTQGAFNPSSLHAEGRQAREALDRAREALANHLGARPKEITFTGGGSEADNLAILGVSRALQGRGKHIITTTIEHHAVAHAFDLLESEGWSVTRLGVDRRGVLEPGAFAQALTPQTTFASIMLANNEIGTLQPIAELAEMAHARGVLVHSDAVQACGQIPIDVGGLGVDLLSISAHKFYGPKGIGALFVREGTPLVPLVLGGGQEYGRRAGTENLAGAVGMARALELALADMPETAARVSALRDRLQAGILSSIDDVVVNGAQAERLPNNCNVGFGRLNAETLLMRLDLEGVAVSTGSACASGTFEPSHVMNALGLDLDHARGVLRFSLGRQTSAADIERVLALLPGVIAGVRAFRTAAIRS